MNEPVVSRHIETVMSVTERWSDTDAIVTPSLIEKSWVRCMQDYGLDPARRQSAQIVDSSLLNERREQMEEFMCAARGGMEQLYKCVSGLGYVLLLTDAQGITVDYIGELDNKPLKDSGLYLGSDWNEESAGTCAVGTCLVERVPLTCHREDHFDSQHISLTCTAAPLYDPTGTFLGVLDVSALNSPTSRDSQQLAFHLTTMYARMIEDANFLRHFRNQWILRLGAAWALIEVSGEAMIAFDEDGKILGVNTSARKALVPCFDREIFVGRQLTDVFECTESDIWRIAGCGGIMAQSLQVRNSNQHYFANITPPRLKSGKSLYMGGGPRKASSTDTEIHLVDYEPLDQLAGNDRSMKRLIEQVGMLANRNLNILIHGETGSGKEILAKAIHRSSCRRDKQFIAVNCSAIPESLIESELFGYTSGTFTGGRSKGMKGLILQSDGGTLFLDEIGDMPLHLQTRLLRVLSESEVLPLGADRPIPIDLNVIAASHRDLRMLISQGDFREDLYYRLCGATMHLPPLRNRSDLLFLVEKILAEELSAQNLDLSLSDAASSILQRYTWPGNIRELRNIIRYAVAVANGKWILPEHLPPEVLVGSPPEVQQVSDIGHLVIDNDKANEERDTIIAVLRQHKWNVTTAAKNLEICRATLYRKMKRHKILPPNQM